jgi:hypothetical protein
MRLLLGTSVYEFFQAGGTFGATGTITIGGLA